MNLLYFLRFLMYSIILCDYTEYHHSFIHGSLGTGCSNACKNNLALSVYYGYCGDYYTSKLSSTPCGAKKKA